GLDLDVRNRAPKQPRASDVHAGHLDRVQKRHAELTLGAISENVTWLAGELGLKGRIRDPHRLQAVRNLILVAEGDVGLNVVRGFERDAWSQARAAFDATRKEIALERRLSARLMVADHVLLGGVGVAFERVQHRPSAVARRDAAFGST